MKLAILYIKTYEMWDKSRLRKPFTTQNDYTGKEKKLKINDINIQLNKTSNIWISGQFDIFIGNYQELLFMWIITINIYKIRSYNFMSFINSFKTVNWLYINLVF